MTRATFVVRRLVVIDLYGAHGSTLRRRLVLAEFPFSAAAAGALGGYPLSQGEPVGWIIGGWLTGIAANYLALTTCAVSLARAERLFTAVQQIDDYQRSARYYSRAQWRMVIPFLILILALHPQHSGSPLPRRLLVG